MPTRHDDLLARLDAAVDGEDCLAGAIRRHKAAIERAGEVRVADAESQRAAEAKHAADQALWTEVFGLADA